MTASGCSFAILSHCTDCVLEDTRIVPTTGRTDEVYEWDHVLVESPLVCDLDFAAETSILDRDSPGSGDIPMILSYPDRQMSPCGLNSVFVVQSLAAQQALIEISNCRIQVAGLGIFPVSIMQTNLQWKGSMGLVHLDLDMSYAKESVLNEKSSRLELTPAVAGSEFEMTNEAMNSELTKQTIPMATSTDAEALRTLKHLMQDEMEDIHHILVGMGVAACFLLLAFAWTLRLVHKPTVRLTEKHNALHQRWQRDEIDCLPSIKPPALPLKYDSTAAKSCALDDASLSPTSRLELKMKRRRMERRARIPQRHIDWSPLMEKEKALQLFTVTPTSELDPQPAVPLPTQQATLSCFAMDRRSKRLAQQPLTSKTLAIRWKEDCGTETPELRDESSMLIVKDRCDRQESVDDRVGAASCPGCEHEYDLHSPTLPLTTMKGY